MFHTIAKIACFFLQPSNLAILLIAVGLMLCRFHRSAARGLIASGFAWLTLAGFLPIGNALVLPLEQRFLTDQHGPHHGAVSGIIVLGGFEDGGITAGRGGLAVNDAAERLTEAVRMAHLLPNVKVVFSGGVGALLGASGAGTAIRQFFIDAGIAPERIVVEDNSRDTYENALLTRQILNPQQRDVWLLITSAFHMPRAIGAFRQVGFNVIPFPVDFRTRNAHDLFGFPGSVASGLQQTDLAVLEWIGLLTYRMVGRSSALFPAP